jgi:surfeit locus 1 family protein
MLSLKFKPKLFSTLIAVVGVVTTAYLGDWQMRRAAYKLDLQQRMQFASAQAAVHLPTTPMKSDDAVYYRVEADGEFRPELTIFLDNKVHDAVVGYEVVTPLRLANSRMHVLVNRGWVKAPLLRSELPAITTPAGAVRVEGIALPPPTRYVELSSNTIAGQVWQNLQFERYREQFGIALQPVLVQQHNDLGDGLDRSWKRVDTGVDRHRAYALQWFVMSAVILFVYLLLNVRRTKAEPLSAV